MRCSRGGAAERGSQATAPKLSIEIASPRGREPRGRTPRSQQAARASMPPGRSSPSIRSIPAVLVLAASLLPGSALHAQNAAGDSTARARATVLPRAVLDAPLPVDSSVTVGKLPNGLRYYIRTN